VAVAGGLLPIGVLSQLVSIGSLLAFILVCVGVLVLRRTAPEAPRPFRAPGVPWVPVLGALVCLAQMVSLPWATWERLIVWLVLGLAIYFTAGSMPGSGGWSAPPPSLRPRHCQAIEPARTGAVLVRSSSRVLILLLALIVGLAALLAYEAQRATRSHWVTADRALRDYATVAAWEFLTATEELLGRGVTEALGPVIAPAASPYDSLPPPAVLAGTSPAPL